MPLRSPVSTVVRPLFAMTMTMGITAISNMNLDVVGACICYLWEFCCIAFVMGMHPIPIMAIITLNMDAVKGKSKGGFLSVIVKKPVENFKFLVPVSLGIMFGFFMGMLIPKLPSIKIISTTSVAQDTSAFFRGNITAASTEDIRIISDGDQHISKIWVPSNPKGAERLLPGIVVSESDLYLRRLWGQPEEDLPSKPKYLVTFTVGIKQKDNINRAVKKFSENFTILLFHYDGITTEWDEFEWSKRAIHISARKQTKWWYAKRFLHPDIVASYDYIFIWDEDLGVGHFDGEEYIKLVRKHGLEISQPGIVTTKRISWRMTSKRNHVKIHKDTEKKPGLCPDPKLPPCAAFVEIMAPVFSREAWRCVWHLIQNDLVHGWGLDFALQKCVEPAHEKIGVVDQQWIVHQIVHSLGEQGGSDNGKAPWHGVRLRCIREWEMLKDRMADAGRDYYSSMKIAPSTD